MAKYLFLLGFFTFAFSFLSAPVAVAEGMRYRGFVEPSDIPVAVPKVVHRYKGVVYNNVDPYMIACTDRPSFEKLREGRDIGVVPRNCFIGISELVLFQEVEESEDYRLTLAFVLLRGLDKWSDVIYVLEFKRDNTNTVKLAECGDSPSEFRDNCRKNIEMFNKRASKLQSK